MLAVSFSIEALVNVALDAQILRARVESRAVMAGIVGDADVTLKIHPEISDTQLKPGAPFDYTISMI